MARISRHISISGISILNIAKPKLIASRMTSCVLDKASSFSRFVYEFLVESIDHYRKNRGKCNVRVLYTLGHC